MWKPRFYQPKSELADWYEAHLDKVRKSKVKRDIPHLTNYDLDKYFESKNVLQNSADKK